MAQAFYKQQRGFSPNLELSLMKLLGDDNKICHVYGNCEQAVTSVDFMNNILLLVLFFVIARGYVYLPEREKESTP